MIPIQVIEARRAYWDRYFERKLRKFFTGQHNKIARLKPSDLVQLRDDAIRIINEDKNTLVNIYIDFLTECVKEFGIMTYKDLRGEKIFSLFVLGMYSWIRSIATQRAGLLNAFSILTIRNIIKKGIEEGRTINDMSKTIKTMYLDQFSKKRAKRIARTETTNASNYGSLMGAKQSGVMVKKIWINTKDNRTRKTHIRAGSHKPIGLDEKFKVGKVLLSYPGDPSGPAEEIINCRCAVGYRRMDYGL
jgi:SPP1 gp7 family putative phage head morphogenesis protein